MQARGWLGSGRQIIVGEDAETSLTGRVNDAAPPGNNLTLPRSETEPPRDPATPLPGIHSKEMKIRVPPRLVRAGLGQHSQGRRGKRGKRPAAADGHTELVPAGMLFSLKEEKSLALRCAAHAPWKRRERKEPVTRDSASGESMYRSVQNGHPRTKRARAFA